MKSFAYLLPLLAMFAIVGVSAYIRLAPSPAQTWHVDPIETGLSSGRNRVLMRADSDMQSPVFAETAEALLARLNLVADAAPRTRILAGGVQDGHITYLTRSKLLGFPDYTSVRAVTVPGGAQLVIYARSRFGQSDIGVNKARITDWLEQLSL